MKCRKKGEISELAGKDELVIDEYRSAVSEGILVNQNMVTVSMDVETREDVQDEESLVSLILFDSLDGRVYSDEKRQKDLLYFEYGEIRLDGSVETRGARKMESHKTGIAAKEAPEPASPAAEPAVGADRRAGSEYRIEAVKRKDHVLIRIISDEEIKEIITALPDSSRYAYIGLTGKHCRICNVRINRADEAVADDYIPRIAEAVSYINVPAGDIPNVQIDGYRTEASEGIPVKDGLTITFHAMSLPTARLVWHCPYIDMFFADDGRVNGRYYNDLVFMRLDGECWETDSEKVGVRSMVNKTDDFEGWDAWKQFNRNGYDSTVRFEVRDNNITVITENAGIAMRNTVIMKDTSKQVYAAITGDQCAVTNICIR